MNKQCGGITRIGERCARSVEGPNGLCWLHDPTRSEERRRAASKAGRSKPNREIQGIKARLEDLADGVLLGTTDRGDAAVVAQVWTPTCRAVSVELQVREVTELEERLEELEASLERQNRDGRGYGA